jgi:protein TonB
MNCGSIPADSAPIESVERVRIGCAATLPRTGDGMLPIATFVIWCGCLAVGAFGFLLQYHRPQPAIAAAPIQVEVLHVDLAANAAAPEIAPLPIEPLATPPPPDTLAQPRISQPIAVARPSPAIAFALPVAGPVQIVEARSASYARDDSSAAASVSSTPAARPLVFGQGEGRQPKPEYPLRARRDGQEGTVTLQLTVGPNGRVAGAEAVVPSPWTLLNEAALRVVRERWRFTPGEPRRYEVSIRFELTK